MDVAATSKPEKPTLTLAETIKACEQRLAQYGPGPHTELQKQEMAKVQLLLDRCNAHLKKPNMSNPDVSFGENVSFSSEASGSVDKKILMELVQEVDPFEQLDDEVQEALLHLADDFIDSVVNSSCMLAKHRGSSSLDAKDVSLVLEKDWDIWVPGYSTGELRQLTKSASSEAHKQRMALIKKQMKKH